LRNSDQGLETLVKVGSRIGITAKDQKEATKEQKEEPKK